MADFAGLTRDRHYGRGVGGDKPFLVVDTGGFEPTAETGIMKEMARQTLLAIDEADVIIFDEATSALDGTTEADISDAVHNLKGGVTVILIAHRLSTIMHADKIYVLEKGEIVETGSHEELLDVKGLYFAMWRQQIGERKRG